jgi:hypothetical protein
VKSPSAIIRVVQRILVTIHGGTWSDFQELELPRLPGVGDLIETKYGTCVVESSEQSPDTDRYDGKIVCSVR